MNLKTQIDFAIYRSCEGQNSQLMIDDLQFDKDIYAQLLNKIYSVIRYKIYQSFKLKNKNVHNHKNKLE